MSLTDVLDHPLVYRTWQAPFARKKLDPVIKSGVLDRVSSVLDVGCGPGTNAPLLTRKNEYVGVDLNPKYIEYARSRYRGEFIVADVTEGLPGGRTFDLVLMNSLMHHLDDEGAGNLLASLGRVVAPEGEIHVLDLRADSGVPRFMANADRGKYARTPDEWTALVSPWLSVRSSGTYPLGLGPVEIWRMIHMVLAVERGAET